ncbi:DsbA family protein [Streptosporangium lutulentum]|uniref:Protein-disulfide isomerase n=1 Tax=Streptosporangium lutulentum TaxID=1461250 RepID=A0ABT9Q9K4_9ACTN|nr:thioredoxin domain-containing protein [Streptosporangium lutulentum]MDP9843081.1 protein-disulfide isomerase [Streptosporangium lutulentum]
MTTNLKITFGIAAVVAAIVAMIAVFGDFGARPIESAADTTAGRSAPTDVLVRPDSHTLSTAADGKVTLVEFLDFECEACGAVFPHMERIRAEYDGRITLVVRYFPLPGHRNGELAARVAEAAGKQDRFEAMYAKLFETQRQWGEASESKEAFFVDLAKQVGLDMTAFQADLAAPATAQRVKKDQDDGQSLGIQGTPTIFFNGAQLTEEPSYDNLKAKIDAALAS